MKLLFIVGCPRSGTTLLQQALNRHAEIVIPPETAFCELLGRSWQRQCSHLRRINADLGIDLPMPSRRLVSLDEGRSLFGEMASRYVNRAGYKTPTYFGDKTPQHQRLLGTAWRLFPESKVVLIYRDGRDVALSLSQLPWMSQDVYVNFALWLHYWRHQRNLERSVNPRLHTVRYEDFVAAPQSELEAICRFLSLEYQPEMLAADGRSENIPVWELPWKSRACEPITADRVGRWQSRLTSAQIERLEHWGAEALTGLGYELSMARPKRVPIAFRPKVYLAAAQWLATRTNFADHHPRCRSRAAMMDEKLAFYGSMPAPPFAYDRGRLALRWLPRGARLLDIGCGPATHLRHLAHKALLAVGIETDQSTLAIARTRVGSVPVSLLQYDGRRLPFADASFDAVTTLDVLEHAEDREALVGEVKRVLCPGGLWIVSVPYHGAVRWLSPENLGRDFPRVFGMLSRLGRPQFWVEVQNASSQRHQHFSIKDIRALAGAGFVHVRSARRGSLLYALAYLAGSFAPQWIGQICRRACFALMAIDYEIPYGLLAYNLAVAFRRVVIETGGEALDESSGESSSADSRVAVGALRGKDVRAMPLVVADVPRKKGVAMRKSRCAVTVVEMLVVVSVIGMLMALLLPAVQASRESARRSACANNLRQISMALLNHESAHDRFPSNGWGFRWQGDPDRGTGPDQPGSWIFNILSYLERTDLARLGAGKPESEKRKLLAQANQVAVSTFYCPSRRAVASYPQNTVYPPHNADLAPTAGKTDYAINAGDTLIKPSWPETYDQAASWHWADFSAATGVSYYRSTVKIAEIRDGTSLTYMIGEKRVGTLGNDLGDDQGLLMGYDQDTSRWANRLLPPLPDGPLPEPKRFGSAHPNVCQFIMCDGSLHEISFAIDPELHRRLGNRRDAQIIEMTSSP